MAIGEPTLGIAPITRAGRDNPAVSVGSPVTRVHGVSVVVAVIGVGLTVLLVFAARVGFERNEDRLLAERTKQAAAVLTAALPGIQTPLASAAEVAEQGDGEQRSFVRVMAPIVPAGQPFVSASLWPADLAGTAPVAVVGDEPKLASQPPEVIRAFLERSTATSGLVVIGLLDGDDPRLGYSYTTESGPVRFIAYAEGALPQERTSVVPPDSAFAGLDNAVYLGDTETGSALLTASTPQLPLMGRRATESVPFGDSSLLLVMTPTGPLSGQLLAALPWLVGGVGAASALGAAAMVEGLARRRDRADALASDNERLYAGQLSVFRTLQQSLLPRELPNLAGVQLAARYVPGVSSLEIGGDWYDAIDLDDGRLLVVVGDVSGRGLTAGTVMASLRYAVRAFASRGDDPAAILHGLTALLDLHRDQHFATVLCATMDTRTAEITIANAGHPPPLLVTTRGVSMLPTRVGPPIGVVRGAQYSADVHAIEPGSSLILFTDGLFERRGETVDVGLERLRTSVPTDSPSIGDTIDRLLATQIADESLDDTALLGVAWTTNPTT